MMDHKNTEVCTMDHGYDGGAHDGHCQVAEDKGVDRPGLCRDVKGRHDPGEGRDELQHDVKLCTRAVPGSTDGGIQSSGQGHERQVEDCRKQPIRMDAAH
eukprot:15146891-Heterocapsa_arctica.AAC.1